MQNIEIEKQIELFKNRVAFLKEWRSSMTQRPETLTFEEHDKVYKLTLEIDSKEDLIKMRLLDIEQIKKQTEQSENEIKANYAMYVNKMKEAVGEIKEPQAIAIIKGIVERSLNPELPFEEMSKDYKLMKSILSIIPKKETPVIELKAE